MVNIEQLNTIKAPIGSVYKALTTEEGLGKVWTSKLTVKPENGVEYRNQPYPFG
jgi:uncharacterized protein YndB with AHSA1/START domain